MNEKSFPIAGIHEININPVVKGFFEDWDGETVLSDVRNYKNEDDFLIQAEKYIEKTRGYKVNVLKPSIIAIAVGDDEWRNADMLDVDFEGEIITVYASGLNDGLNQ